MSSISEWLESYPVRLGALSAAVAATSSLVFPGVLIPANMEFLGPIGSVLTIIVFLVAWALRKELWRSRKPLFLVMGAFCLAALLILVNLNRKYVLTPEIPDPRRLLIGSQLSPWGQEKYAQSGAASETAFIQAIGEEHISRAWGESFDVNSALYTASYLALGAGLLLMIAVAMAPPARVAPSPGDAMKRDEALRLDQNAGV